MPRSGGPASVIGWVPVVPVVDEVLDNKILAREKPACWRWKVVEVPEGANEVEALHAWQRRRCAICGKEHDRGLYHDHDHDTGLLRGLLCPGCNSHEGLSDAPAYEKYRKLHPTIQLGITVQWEHPLTIAYKKAMRAGLHANFRLLTLPKLRLGGDCGDLGPGARDVDWDRIDWDALPHDRARAALALYFSGWSAERAASEVGRKAGSVHWWRRVALGMATRP